MIPFGEFVIDQAPFGATGTVSVINALPNGRTYSPWPAQEVYSDALTARCRGGILAREDDGNTHVIVGDANDLYRLGDATWTEISQTTGAYTASTDTRWEFAQWLDDTIYATNYQDTIQIADAGSGDFADSSATAIPKAYHMDVVRDFLVLGNTSDAVDGAVPNRVRWSAKGDPTADWTVDATSQADYEDLAGSGGWVQRILGGEYGIVFQEESTWRMTYVGSPVVWQFDEIMPGRGLLAPGAACRVGDLVFYLSQDGFEMLINGTERRQIGANRVDRATLNELDANYLYNISCAADPQNKRVFWAIPGPDNTGGIPNYVLVYDYASDRWSYSLQDVQLVLTAATSGYTMDGLDSVNSNLDAIDVSLDSRIWMGGARTMALFDTDNKLAFWSGSPMSATIDTMELQIAPGRRSMLHGVRPIVDGGTVTVRVGSRASQADTRSFASAVSVNGRGLAPVRSNSRYHTIRCNISGTWYHALGVDIEASPGGRR